MYLSFSPLVCTLLEDFLWVSYGQLKMKSNTKAFFVPKLTSTRISTEADWKAVILQLGRPSVIAFECEDS